MNIIGQTYNGYTLNKKLGSGQFGTTYLCNDIYNNIYAIKNINIDEYSKFNLNKSNIDTEIETIKKLSGYISKGNYDNREGMQYIVKYIDNFNMKINGINYMFIVMEYVDGIDMEKYIKSNNKINVENIIKIIFQLIDGLNYIHSLNYAHRDIKPSNIMITINGDIKYVDYGLACRKICKIGKCNDNCIGTLTTIIYLPPEIINKTYSEKILNAKAWDVWQLSLTMFNLCNGMRNFPFTMSSNNIELQQNILKAPSKKSNYKLDDGRINKFIDSSIVNNWKLRPTTEKLVENFSLMFPEYFNNNNNTSKNYKIIKELGRGGFGVTYLATDDENNQYAIKSIDYKNKGINKSYIDFEIETLKNLSKTNNPYVVKYYDSFMDGDIMYIVMEFIDGVELYEYLNQNTSLVKQNANYIHQITLSPTKVRQLIYQLIEGLKYIHSLKYAHRDIKPDNIMITKNGDIKYIDYGLACLQKCKINKCTDNCFYKGGTLPYEPPELFKNQYVDNFIQSKAWDVWSLSVTIFNICNSVNNFPFVFTNNERQLQQNIINAPSLKSKYKSDNKINSFVDSIIVNDWKKRPTIDQIEIMFNKSN